MKTLIILYDGVQMNNVISAAHVQPDIVVVVYPKGTRGKLKDKELSSLLNKELIYVPIDMNTPVTSLREALEPYKGAYVDSNGGHDYAAIILGSLMDEYDFTVVSPNLNRHVISFYNHGRERIENLTAPLITVPGFVAMSEGKVMSSTKPVKRSMEEWAAVDFCNDLRHRDPDKWQSMAKFIQNNLNSAEAKNTMLLREEQYKAHKEFFDELIDHEMLEYDGSGKRNVKLQFTSDLMRELFAIEGKGLEEEVWKQLYASELFTDVREQVRIDWNGDGYVAGTDPTSELDVLATREWYMACISCKTGKLKEEHLYEVFSNAHKFGQGRPIPVLCHDSKDATAIMANKAEELGIILIGQKVILSGKTAEYIDDRIRKL